MRIFEEFWRNWFVVRRRLRTSNLHLVSVSWKFLTTNKKSLILASKRLWRSDLTSDLEFVAQIAYATMFVWTV